MENDNSIPIVPGELYTGDWAAFPNQYDAYSKAFKQLTLIEHIKSYNNILDIGCGAGRLALGLLSNNALVEKYIGIDVNHLAINWCNQNINSHNKKYEFFFLNKYNARYAKKNIVNDDVSLLDIEPFKHKYDLVYLYSVFSHLIPKDIIQYLNIFKHILTINGIVYVTAFVNDNIEIYEENPEYLNLHSGPLHACVYNKIYFEKLIKESGLKILECSSRFQEENDGQLLYILGLEDGVTFE